MKDPIDKGTTMNSIKIKFHQQAQVLLKTLFILTLSLTTSVQANADVYGEAQAKVLSSLSVLKSDYYYWELHLHKEGAIQAARWDDWKAVRNGVTKPIEIYDLSKDPGEVNNLAESNKNLVAKAEQIFKDAHRPDPSWPLDHRAEGQSEVAKKVWALKKLRDQTSWVPENAIKYER